VDTTANARGVKVHHILIEDARGGSVIVYASMGGLEHSAAVASAAQ
jgi:hypothetical protein